VTQKKAIAPLEYLRLLSKETIQEAYHVSEDASFSKEGDRQAAEVLTKHAKLQGYDCHITGATLGRHRSDIGLVKHRSPRGVIVKTELPDFTEPQPLLELQPPRLDTSRIEVLLGDMLKELKQIKAGVFKDRPAPEEAPKPTGPVLVKEAAGGGQ
jgi:hypothetical protein